MRLGLFLLVLVALCCATQTHAQSLVSPPFVRQWTQSVGRGASVVAVEKGILYYQCDDGIGVIDIATGEKKWRTLQGQSIGGTCLRGGTLYTLVAGKDLYAINTGTGSPRLLLHFPLGIQQLTQDPEQLYVLDVRETLHALSPRTGQTLWSTALLSARPPKDKYTSVALAPTHDGIYVGIGGEGEFGEELGIAPENGKVLWRRKASFPALYSPMVREGDVVTEGGKLRRINVRTGNVLWTAKDETYHGTAFGNVLLANGGNTTQGYDLTTGKQLWKDSVYYGDIINGCSDGQNMLIEATTYGPKQNMLQGTYCLSREGRLLWQADKPFTGTPIYADQSAIATYDGFENRFLGYVPGALPRLPATAAGKKALAERQVAQFEDLDEAERLQLEKLKPYSTRAFLPRYRELAKHRIQNLDAYLFALCERENTAALLEQWKHGGGEGVARTLQAKGDPAGFIPTFVQTLLPYAQQIREGKVLSGHMLSTIAHSSHPDAVAFLLEALHDPQAPAEWRVEAFRHLPGTGGAAGVAAVRAERAKPGLRKPWFERLDLEALPKKAIEKDAKGRTWALFFSEILGNSSDLFIVEKKADSWGTPLFTGAWTEGRGFINADAPKSFRGIPIEKLVATEWIKIFPDDPTLRKDTDGDGLTDLVEVRLGTNPKKADTDGDGLPDTVDPCPNAAPRVRGDTEQILSACIEAWLFGQKRDSPVVLSSREVVPFDLYGHPGQLLWQQEKKRASWKRIADSGADEVFFLHPIHTNPPKGELVEYGPDRQTARIVFVPDGGGCILGHGMFTLKKIDGEWFVVDWEKLSALWWAS